MGSLRQTDHERIVITEEAAIGATRRALADLAAGLRGTEAGVERAKLAGTELATNLLRHADPGGWTLVRALPPDHVEIVAVDRGPGIADPATALAGRSPAPKGLGCGLAAARRAADVFDLHTERGRGTVVLAQIDVVHRAGSHPVAAAPVLVGGVSVALGTGACGDGWAVHEADGRLQVLVVDGVGHGPPASAAADAVIAEFTAAPADVAGWITRGNNAARGTRGAVATLCQLEPATDTLVSVAVGNVNGRVFTPEAERGLATYAGSLGLGTREPIVHRQMVAWPPGSVLVLWTDGLRSRLGLDHREALFARHPTVVAAALHRDWARGTDDATVVVLRRPRDRADVGGATP